MRRRAFTMVELMITIVLTGIVVGTIAGMYGFIAVRLTDSFSQSSVCDQVKSVADTIETSIRNADSCTTADGGATLICSMPVNGVDTDGDGYNDAYYPDKTDANGVGQYTVGSYVWFFRAGTTGLYHTSLGSSLIWRADSTSKTSPKMSENDKSFMVYPGGNLRHPLVTTVAFTVNASSKTVTYTVTGSSRIGSESTETSDANSSRILAVTRTVQWRN